MPSSTQGHPASYDETLLAAAPAATKKQIQGGYNPDLLKEKVTPSVTPPPRDVEAQLPSREVSIAPAPTPFYRTKKGAIIIAVVAVVIIAAVVGGAVGGSKKHKNSVLPALTSTTAAQGAGQTGAAGATQEGGSPASTGSSSRGTALPTVGNTGLPTVISLSATQPVATTTQAAQQGQGR